MNQPPIRVEDYAEGTWFLDGQNSLICGGCARKSQKSADEDAQQGDERRWQLAVAPVFLSQEEDTEWCDECGEPSRKEE